MNDENYIIVPKTSDQNLLAKFYSMADGFLCCSKRENFPTTCVEAQCCGTKVIGFDSGGTRETSLCQKDKEENFVEFGDLGGLRKVAENLLKSRNDVAERAAKEYSKENMTKQYMRLYDSDGRKEKILMIDVNCKYSSTGKIVYDLYRNLREDGRRVAISYGRGEVVHEEDIYKFGLDIETIFHILMARVTGYNGYYSPFSTKRLINFIEEYKPDCIHIHELHAYFVNIKPFIEYIKKKNIKCVWTFHCEYMYTGKCGYAYECTGFERGCGKCQAIWDYPKSLFFDKTKQMFRMKEKLLSDMDFTIVTPSEWMAERVKLSFLKYKPIEVIHNGIDTSVFHPLDASSLKKDLGIPDENKVLLAVAPDIMSDRKGGKWVLELAKMMKDEKITFVLVGGGGYDTGKYKP